MAQIQKDKSRALIIQLGNPLLWEKAAYVKIINDKKITKLCLKLLKIAVEISGVGLSVPQIGKSLRIFVISSHPNQRYPNAPSLKPLVVINPEIISFLGGTFLI